MRFPPNLTYLLVFFTVAALLVAGALYLPHSMEYAGRVMTWLFVGLMAGLCLFVFIKPFISFLYARANGVFKVYLDKSRQGIHLFAYHLNASGDGESTRDIQHYYVSLKSGNLYFRKLYSHFMTPADGRSGWGDFVSFEENVLGTPALEKSLQRLSAKAGYELALGDLIQESNEQEWNIFEPNARVTIRKIDTAVDEGFRIVCVNPGSGSVIWQRRI